jgi:hypothetical protein
VALVNDRRMSSVPNVALPAGLEVKSRTWLGASSLRTQGSVLRDGEPGAIHGGRRTQVLGAGRPEPLARTGARPGGVHEDEVVGVVVGVLDQRGRGAWRRLDEGGGRTGPPPADPVQPPGTRRVNEWLILNGVSVGYPAPSL